MDLMSFDVGGMLGLIFLIAIVTLPIAALIDIVISRFENSNIRITWALLVILIPLVGSLAYLVIGTRQKIRS